MPPLTPTLSLLGEREDHAPRWGFKKKKDEGADAVSLTPGFRLRLWLRRDRCAAGLHISGAPCRGFERKKKTYVQRFRVGAEHASCILAPRRGAAECSRGWSEAEAVEKDAPDSILFFLFFRPGRAKENEGSVAPSGASKRKRKGEGGRLLSTGCAAGQRRPRRSTRGYNPSPRWGDCECRSDKRGDFHLAPRRGSKEENGGARRDLFHGFRGGPKSAAPLHPRLQSFAPLGRIRFFTVCSWHPVGVPSGGLATGKSHGPRVSKTAVSPYFSFFK